MATPLAVTTMVYPPALSALVVAGLMLVVVHLRRGLAGLRHLLVYVWAGAAAVALMVVSGQFDYQLRAIIALPTVAQRQEAFRATAAHFLATDLLGALIGFPIHGLAPDLSTILRIPIWLIANMVGLAIVSIVVAAFLWRRRETHRGQHRVILSMVLATVILYAGVDCDEQCQGGLIKRLPIRIPI